MARGAAFGYMKKLEEQKKAETDERQERQPGELPNPRSRQRKKPARPEDQTQLEFPEPESPKSRPGKSPAKPKDKDQINFTDPDSRIMLNSDKAFIQGYNSQAAVDAETHIILAAELTSQAVDSPHLGDMVRQVERNTGRRPRELSADAGYYWDANLKAIEDSGIEAFIPPDRVRHTEWRRMKSPRGRLPRDASPRYLMRRKLRTKRGRARYQLRQTSVEPVFGSIKQAMGFRQLLLRGQDKARSMWRLQCAAFNLMKLYRAQLLAHIAAAPA